MRRRSWRVSHYILLLSLMVACRGTAGTVDDRPTRISPIARLQGSGGEFVAFDSDASSLISADRKELRIWDAKTWTPRTAPIRVDEELRYVAPLSEKRAVLGITDHELNLWNVLTGRPDFTFSRIDCMLTAAAANATGTLVAVAVQRPGAAKGPVNVEIVDVATRKGLHVLSGPLGIDFLVFSPDSSLILGVAGAQHMHTYRVWDVQTGKLVFEPLLTDYDIEIAPRDGCFPAAFSPDGRKLAVSARRSFSIHDSRTGRLLLDTKPSENDSDESYFHGVAYVDGGKKLFAVRYSGVRLWDVQTGHPLTPPIPPIDTNSWALTVDGTKMVTTTGLWELGSGKKLLAFDRGDNRVVAISPDGRRAATTDGWYPPFATAHHDTLVWDIASTQGEQQ